MILPGLVGVGIGTGLVLLMWRLGMLAERSGSAMLLAAVAVFYPVFAVIEGDIPALLVHGGVFLAFIACAAIGFRIGAHIIAAGLIAHAVFDAFLILTGAPGPIWWPVFCAAVDLAAGVLLFLLTPRRTAP